MQKKTKKKQRLFIFAFLIEILFPLFACEFNRFHRAVYIVGKTPAFLALGKALLD